MPEGAEIIKEKKSIVKIIKEFTCDRDDFFILLLFVLNIANIVSVWLLYKSVAEAKEGLVYGPPGNGVKYSLLVFSILGSMAVFYQVFGNRNDNIYKYNQASAIWCIEIPQMVIILVIVACREEVISYFLLMKASLIMVIAVLKIIESWVVFFKEFPSFIPLKRLGFYVLFAMSLYVLIATQTERNADGSLNFKVKHSKVESEYDDRRYFANVSIYFSHSYLDYDTNPSRDNLNLIRLLSIHDLKNSTTYQTVNIHYDSTHTNFLVQISGKSDQCFTRNNKTVTMETCSSDEPPQAGQFAFTFHYVDASFPSLIFGDITFNIHIGNNTNCETPDFSVVDDMEAHFGHPSSVFLRYYRAKPNITEESSLKRLSNSAYEFYQQSDLINIEDIWKLKCKSTGSGSPHRDESLEVMCL